MGIFRSLALILFSTSALGAVAQSLDRDLTDPAAIAQECGGDSGAGKPIFATRCAACHQLSADAQKARGPHLGEIYGRASAGLAQYPYSDELRDTDLVWEGETLHAFLSGALNIPYHPTLDDAQARRDVLTYLRTQTRPVPPHWDDITVPADLLAMQGDAEYGAYLASDCATCHGATGNAIRDLSGLSRAEFLRLLLAYRARALPNPIMQMTAARLSDAELAALAAHYISSAPPAEGG